MQNLLPSLPSCHYHVHYLLCIRIDYGFIVGPVFDTHLFARLNRTCSDGLAQKGFSGYTRTTIPIPIPQVQILLKEPVGGGGVLYMVKDYTSSPARCQ